VDDVADAADVVAVAALVKLARRLSAAIRSRQVKRNRVRRRASRAVTAGMKTISSRPCRRCLRWKMTANRTATVVVAGVAPTLPNAKRRPSGRRAPSVRSRPKTTNPLIANGRGGDDDGVAGAVERVNARKTALQSKKSSPLGC
jgi:hypothetical protein